MPSLSPAYPAFSLFFLPPIPPPPSPAGKGEIFCFLMQGASPLASPGMNLRFAAKPTEFLYLEQCRKPRRGGTGGDGTIRRTRRRRLRCSSPPGQIEQVPHGERSSAPVGRHRSRGRIARWRGACSGVACPAADVSGGGACSGVACSPCRSRPRRGQEQGSTPKAGVAGGKEGKLPPVAAPCKKIFKSP